MKHFIFLVSFAYGANHPNDPALITGEMSVHVSANSLRMAIGEIAEDKRVQWILKIENAHSGVSHKCEMRPE
jgi:hypothetical protein